MLTLFLYVLYSSINIIYNSNVCVCVFLQIHIYLNLPYKQKLLHKNPPRFQKSVPFYQELNSLNVQERDMPAMHGGKLYRDFFF